MIAYAFGPASALCYAMGYISRKIAFGSLPDPALGTFIVSLAALAYYMLGSMVVADYRRAIRAAFNNVNGWQLSAAVSVSIGQLLQFAAIQHTEVSKVTMIASAEIFISIFLSVYVLKTEKSPDKLTLIAATIATAGVAFIAFG